MNSDLDRRLCKALRDHPSNFSNRYNNDARAALLETLFYSLTGDCPEYHSLLFPDGFPASLRLQEAQGAQESSEYTEAARGHACGHIFKQGEASYHCMSCTDDATCVLCARCFDSSDHEGHQFHISLSPGNSGCCDCGDLEAWKRPVKCAIHTKAQGIAHSESTLSSLPLDLQAAIQITIGRVLDYFCDVISCSPENLRQPKTAESSRSDESKSRLGAKWYLHEDDFDSEPEFCLVLWNDEKHTVQEVQDQVARACRQTTKFGWTKAEETDTIGRSVVKHSRDLHQLLKMSAIIEQIKVTVTVRSSRDTFREQMCGTVVEWLSDIAGCSVGDDHYILRHTICEEFLQRWRVGSEAHNARNGQDGIDDHAKTEVRFAQSLLGFRQAPNVITTFNDSDEDDLPIEGDVPDDDAEDDEDDVDDDEDENYAARNQDDGDRMDMDYDRRDDTESLSDEAADVDMGADGHHVEATEVTAADYHPPPTGGAIITGTAAFTPTESEASDAMALDEQTRSVMSIPRTPGTKKGADGQQPRYWSVKPSGYSVDRKDIQPHEDLSKRVRLDWMIMFDLRLWKKARIDLRDLYISTVVNVPQFKRILGLRFSGLYTILSQLYLVADREPDHSIINLSLQMLTSPSITEEVIERGNFWTNLMAILYTFLTTRQVGFPEDVSAAATLVFDTGSVTNRRLYHFFSDLRYFLSSEFVRRRVRTEKQYLLQFLDLAKLSQGICPNVRAVGEHVEYETDAWISASLLTREIDKLCRQFAESFQGKGKDHDDSENTYQAIFTTTVVAIINSVGLERQRFDQCEIKDITQWKALRPYDFEYEATVQQPKHHVVVDFVVEKGALSFHHALHYTLSWLLECGKSTRRAEIMLKEAARQFYDTFKDQIPMCEQFAHPDDALLAMFDYPLRVCAWLAQMKAGMWVRNGMSLRHQMGQYKGVALRDVGYHRDIFMLQTALVTCEPSRVLASMIDRYGLDDWVRGHFSSPAGWEDSQVVDVAEDFIYTLIVLLSDRTSLITEEDEPDAQLIAVKRDIAHTLCFKPMSFSDLNARLTERAQDYHGIQETLDMMTNFRPPEALHDTGMFELKSEYLEELDPYNTNYSKNQRDEAENIYKNWMSKKLNKPATDIVLEPCLRPILSGAYVRLPCFTSRPLFAQIIYYALGYALQAKTSTPEVLATRLEGFLHVVLQLALVATLEDNTHEDEFTEESMESFIRHALVLEARNPIPGHPTIISVLQKISNMDQFTSCRAKIKHLLRLFFRKRQRDYSRATAHLDFPYGRLDTASPANLETELEARKKQAVERKAKVMAQFQQQQQKFMDHQGLIDWGEDDFCEPETGIPTFAETQTWKYPTGVCIQCREETNHSRIYGTFAMIIESNVLRQTMAEDPDWVHEALDNPKSLDRSAEGIRPFGVAGENHEQIRRLNSDGNEIIIDRQGLGKGWPNDCIMKGPVSTGCGHIMHYACFENYYSSIQRRQSSQVARNHPERRSQNEFVCPLCKALGNTFLPIIWKEVVRSYPGVLLTEDSLEHFLDSTLPQQLATQKYHFYQERETRSKPHRQALGKVLTGLIPIRDEYIVDLDIHSAFNDTPGISKPFAELSRTYDRLRETLKILHNNQEGTKVSSLDHFGHLDMLVSCVGHTIAATEIAFRGLTSKSGSTLLDRIPEQTLTHLRILSETAGSYAAMAAITSTEPDINKDVDMVPEEYDDFQSLQINLIQQLFFSHTDSIPSLKKPFTVLRSIGPLNSTSEDQDATQNVAKDVAPLLAKDVFTLLTESLVVLCPVLGLDSHHILQLCYVAEMIKVVLVYLFRSEVIDAVVQKRESLHSITGAVSSAEIHCMKSVVDWIKRHLRGPNQATRVQLPDALYAALYRLVTSYALPFLRKCVILMDVCHGVDYPATYSTAGESDPPELDRLSRLLRLPSLSAIMADFNEYSGKSAIKATALGWLEHFETHFDVISHGTTGLAESRLSALAVDTQYAKVQKALRLLHPCPLELIGLPKYYDVLIEETHHRKCPTTGKELTDPSLCLFCGDIFCSQAVCCMKGGKQGGCNLHVEKYAFPVSNVSFLALQLLTAFQVLQSNWSVPQYPQMHDPLPACRYSCFLHSSRTSCKAQHFTRLSFFHYAEQWLLVRCAVPDEIWRDGPGVEAEESADFESDKIRQVITRCVADDQWDGLEYGRKEAGRGRERWRVGDNLKRLILGVKECDIERVSDRAVLSVRELEWKLEALVRLG